MNATAIIGTVMIISFINYALLMRWHIFPRLANLPLMEALIPLVWIHAFRNVGLTILAPGAVDPSLPQSFSVQIGYGDLASSLLAILSLFALRAKAPFALVLVWILNIVSVLDLSNAALQAILIDAFNAPLGANVLILTMFVPALWISSITIFYLLLTRRSRI